MEKYIPAELEISSFDNEDVITASPGSKTVDFPEIPA